MGLHRLEANIQPGNLASIGLVKGAGFQCEGFSPKYLKIGECWRDHDAGDPRAPRDYDWWINRRHGYGDRSAAACRHRE